MKRALAASLVAAIVFGAFGPTAARAAGEVATESGAHGLPPSAAIGAAAQAFISSPSGLELRQDSFWERLSAVDPSAPRGVEALAPLAAALPADFAALARRAASDPAARSETERLLAEGRARAAATVAAGGAERRAQRLRLRQERSLSLAQLRDFTRGLRAASYYDQGAVRELEALGSDLASRRGRPYAALARWTPRPMRRAAAFGAAIKRMMAGDRALDDFTKPRRRTLRLAKALWLLDVPISLGTGYVTGCLIDMANAGNAPGALQPFIAMAGVLVAMTVADLLSTLKYMYMMNALENEVVAAFRVDLFKRLFSYPQRFFDKHDTETVASRLNEDVTSLTTTGIDIPVTTPYNIVYAAASLGLLLWTNLSIAFSSDIVSPVARPLALAVTALLVVVLVLYGLITSRSADKQEVLEEKYQTERAEMAAHAQRALKDRDIHLSMGIEDRAIAVFEQKAWDLAKLGNAQARVEQKFHFKEKLLGILSTDLMITLATSALLFFEGFPTVGMITTLTAYAVGVTHGVEGLANDYANFKKHLGGSAQVKRLRGGELDQDPPGAVELGPLRGRIEFQDVTFAYDSLSDPVLKGVSFTIEPGESVAIVGPSGSGKSTLFKLLTRLYRPSSGRILVDGQDIAGLKIKSLRTQLSLVPQESGLIDASVRENLLAVRPDATPAAIADALSKAGALEFMLAKSRRAPPTLDDALDVDVSELSGGQEQRIAIARALLRDSKVMLLDEWSSALDQETERRVGKAVGALDGSRTTVFIDHNLRFDKKKTRILVLEDGRIVASGKHKDLMKTSPLYKDLVDIARDAVK